MFDSLVHEVKKVPRLTLDQINFNIFSKKKKNIFMWIWKLWIIRRIRVFGRVCLKRLTFEHFCPLLWSGRGGPVHVMRKLRNILLHDFIACLILYYIQAYTPTLYPPSFPLILIKIGQRPLQTLKKLPLPSLTLISVTPPPSSSYISSGSGFSKGRRLVS